MQILAAGGFCRLTLNKKSTSVKLVEDFGNAWFCTLVYGRHKYAHFKIGGGNEWWRREDLGGALISFLVHPKLEAMIRFILVLLVLIRE